jgi:hypothetical protein
MRKTSYKFVKKLILPNFKLFVSLIYPILKKLAQNDCVKKLVLPNYID